MNFDIEWPASASALGRAVQKKRSKWPIMAGGLLTLAIIASVVFQFHTMTTATNYEIARAGRVRDVVVALDDLNDTHDAAAVDSAMRHLRQLMADDAQQQAGLDRSIRSRSFAWLLLSLLPCATLCLYYAAVYNQTRGRPDSEKSINDARRKLATRNTLVSRLSFDIRSALMAILGYCDLPREEGSTAEDRLNSIREQTRDIVAAVDGFLETPTPSAALARPLTGAKDPGEPHLSTRVLLAEDDPHLQEVIKFYLQSSRAEVVIVADGQLAFEQAMASSRCGKPFDLILMDVQMPRLDGCQATIRLREAGYAYPIVALTADATDLEQRRCMAAGCNGFLAKPVDREEFLQVTRRFVRRELSAPATPDEVAGPIFDAQMDALRESFRGQIRLRVTEIAGAVSDKDLARVSDLAHRLKGTSACYGFAALADSSDALQSAAALPEGEEMIRQCLQTLSEQAEKSVRAQAA
jgi:CheY-like chemotaxis protein